MGLFWSIIFSQIWLSVGPIFTVLPITFTFLIHFWPMKYRIKGLDVLFSMVRKWSIKSCFWPGHGHGLGQTWSTLVNFSQLWSNLSKPHELCPPDHVLIIFWCIWAALGLNSTQSDYLVLRANTRGNLGGINWVITPAEDKFIHNMPRIVDSSSWCGVLYLYPNKNFE